MLFEKLTTFYGIVLLILSSKGAVPSLFKSIDEILSNLLGNFFTHF